MAVLKDGTPDVALHAKTWALVKQWVPAEALADLIYRDSYRQTMHATPAALISQLPLYESKLGYVLLLKALSPVADPIGAMRAVSLVCTLGILLVLFCECSAIRGVASLAWLPFVGLFGLSEFATMLSPDPVATFLYVVAFAALLAGRLKLALGLAVLAVFIRPEGVVLNVMLFAVLARRSPAPAAVLLLASAALCFANLALSSHIGWWAQFHFNFVDRPPDLAAPRPGFDFRTFSSCSPRRSGNCCISPGSRPPWAPSFWRWPCWVVVASAWRRFSCWPSSRRRRSASSSTRRSRCGVMGRCCSASP